MKVACSTAGFTKQPLDKTLEIIKGLGFNYVDLLMMENWAHINPSELVADPISKAKQTAELLKDNSLTVIGINANLSNPINTGKDHIHKSNMAETKALCIFAREIGIPVLVLQPGRIIDELGAEKSRENSIQALKDMAEIANEYDIIPAIETHVDSVAEEYADSLAMVQAVPGLKLAYDPSHFVMTQQELADSEMLIKHSAHVHLRNAVVGNFQAAMDKGIMDFDWVLGALKKNGYDGYIAIEYIDSTDEYSIEEQILKLKDIIEKA